MSYHIAIQKAAGKSFVPKTALLRKWANQALQEKIESAEITIRVVGEAEMSTLNASYRHKQGPTNVLSFPSGIEEVLGDIVICADVVNREAEAQGKSVESHWAHMVVHGIFHLLGYDHEKESDAAVMEALEVKTMQKLGYANPYELGQV